MSNFQGYRYADIKNCCEEEVTKLEKVMKDKSNKDIVLIAYEKQ